MILGTLTWTVVLAQQEDESEMDYYAATEYHVRRKAVHRSGTCRAIDNILQDSSGISKKTRGESAKSSKLRGPFLDCGDRHFCRGLVQPYPGSSRLVIEMT